MSTDAELFEKALVGNNVLGGTIMQQCSCGRTHFAIKSIHFDDGELEALEEKQRKDPDAYVAEDCDSILVANVGLVRVIGCPCGWEERHAAFLVTYRKTIVAFYRLKAEQAAQDAAAATADMLTLLGKP